METREVCLYNKVIDDICDLDWSGLDRDQLVAAAWAYYYFSVQFRESLEIACALYDADPKLQQLHREECNTSNLSPWPGVAGAGERMNHDEFMRRLLLLCPVDEKTRIGFEALGRSYLAAIDRADDVTRALSISSYEDGGLERVFGAMLRAPDWDNALLGAFRHFLTEHIRFDSDAEQGHGALSRHLVPDDRILPVWAAFKDILVGAVPRLAA